MCMHARCKNKCQAAAPRWALAPDPSVSPPPCSCLSSWLWVCTLWKMNWMIVIWQLCDHSFQENRSALSKNTQRSLPHWNCIIMPCVARYAPLPVHNGLTIQGNFPLSWAALNSSWYLGLILRLALLSVCHLVCAGRPALRPVPSWARILWSQ